MTPGLVSILMPVLNGELWLRDSLPSLLAQSYSNFELIILDNQSTDRTGEICREFAAGDRRVRYVLDDVNRISHDAANHLATLATGEYAMYACDDDVWDSKFVESLVGCLEGDLTIDLAYCNACYVDVDGNRGRRRLLASRGDIRRVSDAPFWNFWHFVRRRRIVPMLFGVYRTTALRDALPFDTFDETIADVDTLFLLEFMSGHRPHYVDGVLFWSRAKYRAFVPELIEGLRENPTAFDLWLYQARHQWRLRRKIHDVIARSPFSRPTRVLLHLRSDHAFVYAITWARVRAAVGASLVRLGLREGAAWHIDRHHEARVQAHRRKNFGQLVQQRANVIDSQGGEPQKQA